MAADRRVDAFAQMDLFHEYADRLPLIIWQRDAGGTIVFTNEAWHEYTGLPRRTAPRDPETCRRIIHPDDFEKFSRVVADAIASRSSYRVEYRLRPAGGGAESYRWHVSCGSTQYADGVFVGWLGSTIDVEETRLREVAEQRLRDATTRRETEFYALAEAVPQIVWTADATGSLDWYNHGWYDYTGQTPEEAAGWGWQAVHHPEDFPLMMEQWTSALASGERVEMEFRLRGRDGKFRWFLTLVNPLKDANGRVLRWFGTNTDIHERKENIERSKRVAQTLQEVFLPERLPQSDEIDFDAMYLPAESDAFVGGDWYDAFTLDDGRIVISIGDVAGHGLDAAVIAGRLRQTIFAEALDDADPAAVLRKADRVLRAQTPTMATALVAVIDPATNRLQYASAGHPAPLAALPGMPVAFLPDGSAPLGTGFTDGGLQTETSEFALADDAMLVFHTDGIVEFSRDIIDGRERLRAVLEQMRDGALPSTARDIVAGVLRGHATHDDVAVVLVRWRPVLRSLPLAGAPLRKEWRFHSSHAHSARTSRHELMTFVREHASPDEDEFQTEVVIGELLANTVEHAPGLVEIAIDWTDEWPVLTMRDAGTGFEPPRAAPAMPDEFSEDGRGLWLVRNLSRSFAVTASSSVGTTVRVELPIRRNGP